MVAFVVGAVLAYALSSVAFLRALGRRSSASEPAVDPVGPGSR